MYACLAVTYHLHFWQNDRDFLRATVVARGWNGYRNKSQHRKSTLEKKILPPFQQGFEPATFQSRVRCSNNWAIPAPLAILSSTSTVIHSVKQRLLRNRPGSALRPLTRKITNRIHSSKPASLNRPIARYFSPQCRLQFLCCTCWHRKWYEGHDMWVAMGAGGGRPWCQYDSNRASLSDCPVSWSREIASGMPIKLPGTWIALSSKSEVTDLQQTARSTSIMNAFLLLPLVRMAFVTALSVCTTTVRPAHSGAHLATAEATAQTSL